MEEVPRGSHVSHMSQARDASSFDGVVKYPDNIICTGKPIAVLHL